MQTGHNSPAHVRNIFGSNLRKLAEEHRSISDLSRKLQINRTQFNRYLAGESFPRPDVLARICQFFEVDARILLEPLDDIAKVETQGSNVFLDGYVAAGAHDVSEDNFPSGFYLFSRRSFVNSDVFVLGLVRISRHHAGALMRGYESKAAMALQNLPADARTREFRGLVMRQENGIAILASRANAMTCSFNFLSRVASFHNNFWLGYVTRTIPETPGGVRATRLVYEYLGPRMRHALAAARRSGFCRVEDLQPFHKRLLQPDMPFA